MAKNTRKLSIVVAVRDQTKKALGGITARLRRFGEAASKAIATAFKVGLAAAAAALAVFVVNVKKQFEEIDRLAKDAFRFDIPIEQIAGLELAAKLAGLSLDQMMTIMRDMQRRVSEAAEGTGEAADAIEKLGLSARDLNRMGLIEQFDTISRALKEQKNLNDRNRLAYEIMGRSGVQAMTMLGSSIQARVFETQILGTALDNEIGGNIQDANDEVARMHEAFKGVYRTVAGLLAPAVDSFAKSIKQVATEFRYVATVWVPTLELQGAKMIKTFHEGIALLTESIERGILFPINQTIKGLNVINRQLNRPQLLQIEPFSVAFADRISEALRNTIRELEGDIERASRQGGGLPSGFGLKDIREFFRGPEGMAGGGDDSAERRPAPAGMPGLTGGRLLTGAAQSSAERLAAIQQAADAKRAKEAAEARKQREKSNQLLGDLLRSALSGNSNLGGLLQ